MREKLIEVIEKYCCNSTSSYEIITTAGKHETREFDARCHIDTSKLADAIIALFNEEEISKKIQPNPDIKEPIRYDVTLAHFANQLNIALWKAMALGKYFQGRLVRPMGKQEIIDIMTKAEGEAVKTGKDVTRAELATALLTAMKGKNDK